ncbi:helix-turn-helix domain-containing protein [Sphingopyxis granuli]|uniref:helix-turn-helix domain-containing protein n=1 Tax=Sphingopyxis granuli TaxID=267128 RepID=UPI001BAE6DE5|nr:helix-turn-helix domain-containing protein [Sphingopyxis granuli]QUM70857.1 helix-turn-helix domain-containing protein [Sphingopyxis granuli]
MTASTLKEDLLSGMKAIAAHIGETEMTTYNMVRKGEVPAFQRGRKWFARKSEIDAAFRSAA